MKNRSQYGFTLLEVIIALVVLSAALIPLVTLFTTHIDGMKRVADENEKVEATQQILAYMAGINPMAEPEGETDFGRYTVKYTTQIIVDAADTQKNEQGGSFKVQLYEAEIIATKNAEKTDQDIWFELKLRLTGHEKLKSAGLPTRPESSGAEGGEINQKEGMPSVAIKGAEDNKAGKLGAGIPNDTE